MFPAKYPLESCVRRRNFNIVQNAVFNSCAVGTVKHSEIARIRARRSIYSDLLVGILYTRVHLAGLVNISHVPAHGRPLCSVCVTREYEHNKYHLVSA